MAGLGFKRWFNGDVLYSSDLNGYLGDQVVMVFANSSARTTALGMNVSEGMVSYLKDTDTVEVYDGTNWVGFTGDITALSAGTGISLTSATGPIPTVAIDTAVVPRLANANTFTATNTFNAAGTTAVDLIVRATASQTADLQQWQDSTNAVLAYVTSAGVVSGAGLLTGRFIQNTGTNTPYLDFSSNKLVVNARVASYVGFIVQGAASQTADLQQWQNSAGTVLAYVNSGGSFYAGSSLAVGTSALIGTPNLGVAIPNAAVVGVIVRGAASQTANLQQWQNSAGTVLASIDANGTGRFNYFGVGSGVAITAMNNTLITSASTIGVIVKGAASQTANLQEWQNSAGGILVRVESGGNVVVDQAVRTQFVTNTGNTGAYIDTAAVSGSFSVIQRTTTAVNVIVKAVASQTADLQQWQDSSGSAVAYVNSAGVGRFLIVQSTGAQVDLRSENGGGQVTITKQTAAASNPGSGNARLYFRDGTNAGTLKLVVRAGAAGAETTILDNIPQ